VPGALTAKPVNHSGLESTRAGTAQLLWGGSQRPASVPVLTASASCSGSTIVAEEMVMWSHCPGPQPPPGAPHGARRFCPCSLCRHRCVGACHRLCLITLAVTLPRCRGWAREPVWCGCPLLSPCFCPSLNGCPHPAALPRSAPKRGRPGLVTGGRLLSGCPLPGPCLPQPCPRLCCWELPSPGTPAALPAVGGLAPSVSSSPFCPLWEVTP